MRPRQPLRRLTEEEKQLNMSLPLEGPLHTVLTYAEDEETKRAVYEALLDCHWLAPVIRGAVLQHLGYSHDAIQHARAVALQAEIDEHEAQLLKKYKGRPRSVHGGVGTKAVEDVGQALRHDARQPAEVHPTTPRRSVGQKLFQRPTEALSIVVQHTSVEQQRDVEEDHKCPAK